MGLVRIWIDREVIQALLDFPVYAKIIGARLENLMSHYQPIELLIDSPDLPDVKEGEKIPLAYPEYRVHTNRSGDKVSIFENWGVVKGDNQTLWIRKTQNPPDQT